jgi:hypothetical protein
VPALDKVIEKMKKQNTMVPGTPARRGDWAIGMDLKDATKEKVEVLYHVGCLTSFNQDMWKLAQGTASC